MRPNFRRYQSISKCFMQDQNYRCLWSKFGMENCQGLKNVLLRGQIWSRFVFWHLSVTQASVISTLNVINVFSSFLATQYYNVIVFFSLLNSSFLISSLIFFCYSRWNKASRGFACEAAIWEMRNVLHSTKVHQLTSCSYEKHIFVLLLLQSWFCFPYLNVYST
jgi:hypothetical protein